MGFKYWLDSAEAVLPATPENVAKAKAFLLKKWQERSAYYAKLFGRQEEPPTDLTNACKFASLFAQKVFGGKLRGNYHHQWVEMPDKTRLDLTDGVGFEEVPYMHDRVFWGNREHQESLASCVPRVDEWVKEFLRETKQG